MSVVGGRIRGMSSPVDLLNERVGALAGLVEGMPWADTAELGELLAGAKDATVLDLAARVGEVVRLADAVAAHIAGEIERRSDRTLEAPLATRLGERNAPAMIASITRVHATRARDWCEVGTRLSRRTALTGEPLPSLHPVVAESVDDGSLGIDASRVILATLRQVEPFTTVEDLAGLERFLVDQAAELPLTDLTKLCRALPDRFNPDGIEPREEAARARADFSHRPPGRDLQQRHPLGHGVLRCRRSGPQRPNASPQGHLHRPRHPWG
ncbi:hypothetical protein DDQ50_08865 [Amnibacterium flavum]|uniref:DUF222 domain-containing protein n=1 Tax=Amnibacterium flavum TaxID=2173173 RepID=A0A2V1HN23_9MICO|nr:hypothetical protein DDQ50_08865 [Amnibacterium flavum]